MPPRPSSPAISYRPPTTRAPASRSITAVVLPWPGHAQAPGPRQPQHARSPAAGGRFPGVRPGRRPVLLILSPPTPLVGSRLHGWRLPLLVIVVVFLTSWLAMALVEPAGSPI